MVILNVLALQSRTEAVGHGVAALISANLVDHGLGHRSSDGKGALSGNKYWQTIIDSTIHYSLPVPAEVEADISLPELAPDQLCCKETIEVVMHTSNQVGDLTCIFELSVVMEENKQPTSSNTVNYTEQQRKCRPYWSHWTPSTVYATSCLPLARRVEMSSLASVGWLLDGASACSFGSEIPASC